MDDVKKKIDAAVAHVKQDLIAIRGGRAMPSLVEDVVVEQYGTKMTLKQVASVSIPEPRTIAITPWDKTAVATVAKALEQADLGAMPSVHGEVIHVVLPPLTKDRRTQLLRLVGKTVEEGKIVLRHEREEIIDALKQQERGGALSEDAFFREKERIEKAFQEANEHVEVLRKKKEEELESV